MWGIIFNLVQFEQSRLILRQSRNSKLITCNDWLRLIIQNFDSINKLNMLSRVFQKHAKQLVASRSSLSMAQLKTQGDLNIMFAAMQNGQQQQSTSMQSAGFFTVNKTNSQSGLFSHTSKRAYAANSEEASDSEISSEEDGDTNARAQNKFIMAADLEDAPARRDDNAIKGLDAHEAMDTIRQNLEQVVEMDEQALSVYIHMLARSMALNPRGAKEKKDDIAQFCNKIGQRLEKDLENGQPTNILHELGNLRQIMIKRRLTREFSGFQRSFVQSVNKGYEMHDNEMVSQKFSELSFHKNTMTLLGVPDSNYNSINKVTRRLSQQLKDKNDPKSIPSIFRLLEKLTYDTSLLIKSTQILKLVEYVLIDPEQFDLENSPIELKARLLKRYSVAAFHSIDQASTRVIDKILKSIQNDLNKLEERQVIELLESSELINNAPTILQNHTKNMAQDLTQKIVALVVEMAQKRSQLVDFIFLTDFQYLLMENKTLPKGIQNMAINKLSDIMADKLQETENREIVISSAANSDKFTYIANRTKNQELKLLCFDTLASNFHKPHKLAFFIDLCRALDSFEKQDSREKYANILLENMNGRIENLRQYPSMGRSLGFIYVLEHLQNKYQMEEAGQFTEELFRIIQEDTRRPTPLVGLEILNITVEHQPNGTFGPKYVQLVREVLEKNFFSLDVNFTHILSQYETVCYKLNSIKKMNPELKEISAEILEKVYQPIYQPANDERNLQQKAMIQSIGMNVTEIRKLIIDKRATPEMKMNYANAYIANLLKVFEENPNILGENLMNLQKQLIRFVNNLVVDMIKMSSDSTVFIDKQSILKLLEKVEHDQYTPNYNHFGMGVINRVKGLNMVNRALGGIPKVFQGEQEHIFKDMDQIAQNPRKLVSLIQGVSKFDRSIFTIESKQKVAQILTDPACDLPELINTLNSSRDIYEASNKFRFALTAKQTFDRTVRNKLVQQDQKLPENPITDQIIEDNFNIMLKVLLDTPYTPNRLFHEILMISSTNIPDRLYSPEALDDIQRILDEIYKNDSPVVLRRKISQNFTNQLQRNTIIKSKLAKKVIKSFVDNHGSIFAEFRLNRNEFLDFAAILSLVQPKRLQFNDFITGFGNQFEEFSVTELVKFVRTLSRVELNQVDIFNAVNERILNLLQDESVSESDRKQLYTRVIIDLVWYNYEMNCQEDDSLRTMMSDEFVSKFSNCSSFAEIVTKGKNVIRQIDLVVAFLVRSDIHNDPFAKDFVQKVGAAIEEKEDEFQSWKLTLTRFNDAETYKRLNMYYTMCNVIQNKERILGDIDLKFKSSAQSAVALGFQENRYWNKFQSEVTKLLGDMGYDNLQNVQDFGIQGGYLIQSENTVVHPIQSGIVLNDKSSTVNARFGNELIKANFDLEDVKLADIRQQLVYNDQNQAKEILQRHGLQQSGKPTSEEDVPKQVSEQEEEKREESTGDSTTSSNQ